MSVYSLSQEAQNIADAALRMAQEHHHEELDNVHLLYVLLKTPIGEDWLKQVQKKDDRDLLLDLLADINSWYSAPCEYTEPSGNYLRMLHSAEKVATEEGADEVTPLHLFKAILRQDHRIIEWLSQRIILPVEAFSQKKTPLLDQISRDLTALARQRQLMPVIGREKEVQQLIEVLLRQGKNSTLLIGPAGVGKTAIVERLAQNIAEGSVPAKLENARLVELNLAALIAGTSFRGEFEERINALIKELETNRDIILVIDEFHALLGTGTTSHGGPDAVSILKPALARGDITCIGITTNEDYVRYVESDAALVRRFHVISVTEPSTEETRYILAQVLPRYLEHHRVKIEEGVIDAVVRWADRYLPSRHFPDKAIDVLAKAFARAEIQGLSSVTQAVVAEILTEMAGTPVGDIDQQLRKTLVHFEKELSQYVIGQEEAIQTFAQAVRMAYTGLRDPRRPKGVFLFTGPSGVGKTELARVTAKILFGSENALIRFDMSEYAERLNVSRLIGSAPGYVGYDQPGQLTQALRDHPYSVVLFDEVEKACSEIYDLFLQLFDEGRITDSHGRLADGRNCFFIMTSNLTAKQDRSGGFGFMVSTREQKPQMNEEAIRSFFRPEFLNRVDHIIHFRPLDLDDLAEIARMEIDKLVVRLADQSVRLSYDNGILALIANEAAHTESGARAIKRVVENLIAVPLSTMLLQKQNHLEQWLHLEIDGKKISFVWM